MTVYEEDKLIPEESPHVRIIKELEEENSQLKNEISGIKYDNRETLRDHPYLDISHDGMRLDRNIKRAEKRLRKKDLSTEDFIKLSNSMTYMISKKMPLADLVLGVSDIVKRARKKASDGYSSK